MLNKDSYEVLKNFPERLYIKDKRPIHHELFNAGYLAVGWENGQNYYHMTQKGKTAVEEYERTQREERRGDDALDIARESNDIARKANCKSTVAIVVAVIAILVQIISDFGPELWGLVQHLFKGLNNT